MSEIIVMLKYGIRAIKGLFFPRARLSKKPDLQENSNTKCPTQNLQNEWIIDGKVYDLSPFLDSHPGGKHILSMNRGRDCTELFFMYHISSKNSIESFLSRLSQYYISDASPEQIASPFKWSGKHLAIYSDFKARVRRHFDDQAKVSSSSESELSECSRPGKASAARMLWYFTLGIALIFAHFYWFNGYWLSLPVLSLLHWVFSTDLLHNGTHYQLVRNPYINQALSLFGGLYHVPNIQWEMQHVISHHSYTNIYSLDVDLNHFLNNFRCAFQQKYWEIYTKWRYCIPAYILLTSVGQMDVWQTKGERNLHRAMVPFWSHLSGTAWYIYFTQLLWIFVLVPGALYYRFGMQHFFKAFLFLLLPRVGHGAFYYVFSQVSHIHTAALGGRHDDDDDAGGEEEDELQSESWIIHQIKSCVDYDVSSRTWNILSIGLNNQCIHHLCPSVHPCHFIALQREVLDPFCEDYNVKRRLFPNIYVALLSYFEHLALVNDSAKAKSHEE
eukprot:CAMPEP_0202693642 /NCGR_PEP_ID=MMETSP1385-20130828/7687_1 /ASSEMBLY_ACC=CAM_ASM_000861 /TAXON_ID=933848 /ORGANISM="Elphidium margaritaceum" /LENGTH=499 /DNA_ID=CAMNT_0049349339 /DNA_START=32 /DNA_END=1531 /DNA_ORIENTATION=-